MSNFASARRSLAEPAATQFTDFYALDTGWRSILRCVKARGLHVTRGLESFGRPRTIIVLTSETIPRADDCLLSMDFCAIIKPHLNQQTHTQKLAVTYSLTNARHLARGVNGTIGQSGIIWTPHSSIGSSYNPRRLVKSGSSTAGSDMKNGNGGFIDRVFCWRCFLLHKIPPTK